MNPRDSSKFTLVAAASSPLLILAVMGGCSSAGTTNPLPTFGCTENCSQPPGDSGVPSPPGSDSGTTPPPTGMDSGPGIGDAMMTTQNTTWADGHQITASVVIAAGVTITIAPGAKVTVANGASIVVNGTLTASSATPTHASLSGSSWGGIIVASAGSLSLDGVDITGASTALHAQTGNGTSAYNDGTITGATVPFLVDVGGQLSTTHGTVTGTLGFSTVNGSFTASHLDYASNGHPGFETDNAAAKLSIDDSTLHGIAPTPGTDMITSATGAASIHVGHTEITQVHCAFHFDSISAFDITYVTADSDAWGAMLYGSSRNGGPYSITYSNFENNSGYGLDEQGLNGPIVVDHCYFSGNGTDQNVANPAPTNTQTTAISGAGPRPG